MEYLKKNWNNWNWNALQNYISPKKQEYQLSKPKKNGFAWHWKAW